MHVGRQGWLARGLPVHLQTAGYRSGTRNCGEFSGLMQGTNARSSVSTETRSGRGNLYLDGSTASYFHESRGAWWSSIIYREGYIIHKNKLHLSAFSLLGGPMYIVSFPGPDLLTWATCSAAPFCDFLPVSQNGTVDYPQISHKYAYNCVHVEG